MIVHFYINVINFSCIFTSLVLFRMTYLTIKTMTKIRYKIENRTKNYISITCSCYSHYTADIFQITQEHHNFGLNDEFK